MIKSGIYEKNILANIFYNFVLKAITYLFSFLTFLYAARVLEPESFGRTSFASSVAGYFIMLANLGLPIYAMRACAEKRGNRKALSHIFNELWSISIVLSFISGIALILAIFAIPKLSDNKLIMLAYGSAILFQMLGCEWLFKGLEKFGFLAVSGFLIKATAFVCILLFVHNKEQIFLYALISVLAGYGNGIISFIFLRHYVDISFRIHINKRHFKPLLVFFFMSCAVFVYNSLDITMLGFMKTDRETGLYSIAAKGKSILTMMGGLVWGSVLPVATKLWKEGKRRRFESLAVKSLVIVSGIQTVLAVFCIVFADKIIMLAGGEAYLDAVMAFRILLLSLPPIAASNILGGQVLIPAGLERKLLMAEITGAVFNFFANLILIPFLSIEGAAITTVISEVIVWLLCIYYAKADLAMDFGFGLIKKTVRKLKKICINTAVRIEDLIGGGTLPYYCPCCNTHLRQFVDGGYRKRPEIFNADRYQGIDQRVICPLCHSLPRHRIIAEWLKDNEELIKNKDVLHFAQEKSLRRLMDSHHIKYATADLYNDADLRINIEDTGLCDESYDMIICNHVLEHVSDYRKALAEVFRILRPGGKAVISFPVDPSLQTVYEDERFTSGEDRLVYFGQRDHLRIFGMDSVNILESFGFTVGEIRGDRCDSRIKPVIGPADYDYNVLWCLIK